VVIALAGARDILKCSRQRYNYRFYRLLHKIDVPRRKSTDGARAERFRWLKIGLAEICTQRFQPPLIRRRQARPTLARSRGNFFSIMGSFFRSLAVRAIQRTGRNRKCKKNGLACCSLTISTRGNFEPLLAEELALLLDAIVAEAGTKPLAVVGLRD
jgi:hypothetical protein